MKKIKIMILAMVAMFIVFGNNAFASFPVKSEKKQIKHSQVTTSKTDFEETPIAIVHKDKIAKSSVVSKSNKSMGDGSGFAITGFIASILGLFILPIVFLPLGIIFSALGLKSGKKGLAIAGLVIGIVGVLLTLALLMILI
jgi:hypothetical protein